MGHNWCKYVVAAKMKFVEMCRMVGQNVLKWIWCLVSSNTSMQPNMMRWTRDDCCWAGWNNSVRWCVGGGDRQTRRNGWLAIRRVSRHWHWILHAAKHSRAGLSLFSYRYITHTRTHSMTLTCGVAGKLWNRCSDRSGRSSQIECHRCESIIIREREWNPRSPRKPGHTQSNHLNST